MFVEKSSAFYQLSDRGWSTERIRLARRKHVFNSNKQHCILPTLKSLLRRAFPNCAFERAHLQFNKVPTKSVFDRNLITSCTHRSSPSPRTRLSLDLPRAAASSKPTSARFDLQNYRGTISLHLTQIRPILPTKLPSESQHAIRTTFPQYPHRAPPLRMSAPAICRHQGVKFGAVPPMRQRFCGASGAETGRR